MGWVRCVCWEKLQRAFVARTFALITPVHHVLHRVSCNYETIPSAPKYYKGPMGWIGCVHCEKSERDFVARTFSWIAPVHTVLPRVSCSYKTRTNAPKHNETYENMSLGSNGVDWVRSLRKIPTWLRGMNFALIAPVHPVLHRVSCSYETIPNAPKHYTTHQNMSLGSNGAYWVRSLWKIPTWLRGTNFCFNCTSSLCFASSFMQLWNDPKCNQKCATHQNMSLGSNGVECVRS